jgi:hypothetical protein
LLLAGLNDRIWDLFRVCKIEAVFTRYSTVAEAENAVETEAGTPERQNLEAVPDSEPQSTQVS